MALNFLADAYLLRLPLSQVAEDGCTFNGFKVDNCLFLMEGLGMDNGVVFGVFVFFRKLTFGLPTECKYFKHAYKFS